MRRIAFKNRELDVAGILYLPEGFDATQKYAAVVLATPGSSVKEQIGSIYAEKMARKGFVALTFDPSYQGESSGEPRDLEDPATRAEDIRCAVDFLMTQDFIDEERLGLLGICAGGGYAVSAALTEHRFKAIGTVVASDIGRAFRTMLATEGLPALLKQVGKQRTADARSGVLRRDPWIPDSMKDTVAAGIKDPDLLEAVEFYRESSYRHSNSTNRLLFRSYSHILGYDGFHLVPELLTQPLLVIVGGRRGTTGQYESGQTLYNLSPSADKEFFEVEGAGHYEMYHKPVYVDQAVNQLYTFFTKHLAL